MSNDEVGFRITNFRDFGGYQTKSNMTIKRGFFYRSAHLDRIKGAPLEEFNDYKVKTIIDLRSLKERKSRATHLEGTNKISLPINYDEKVKAQVKPIIHKKNMEEVILNIVTTAYSELVIRQTGELKSVFELLTRPESYPILIHCRAGKDRTGFVCAVIQLALGVSEDDVIKDYLLSNRYYMPVAKKIMRRIKIFTLGLFRTKNFEFILTIRERYIRAVLSTIKERFGTVENYLQHCGIDTQTLLKVKKLVLE